MARDTLQAKITADAVFASELQRSDEPSPSSIRKAVQAAMRTFGSCGCRLFHSPGSARSPGADPGGRMRSQPTSMPA